MASMAAEAGPPFDDPSADLILRTSDGVDFRVRSAVVATASPVFNDILSMPAATHAPDDTKDGLPICALTETSAVMRTLLRFCYPLEHPTGLTLDEVIPVLVAALKYQMEGTQAMAALKAQLVLHANDVRHILRVYGVAVRLGFEDEARAAARAALQFGVSTLSKMEPRELADAPASALQRLFKFVDQCSQECGSMCSATPDMVYPWMDTDDLDAYEHAQEGEIAVPVGQWSVYGLESCMCTSAVAVSFGALLFFWGAPKWWWDFLQAAGAALRRRPVGETVKDAQLLRDTHRNIAQDPGCEYCRVGIESFQLMQGFIEFMAKKVDERTLELAQQTNFC